MPLLLAVIASMVVPAGAGQLANEHAEAQALADKIAALGQQEAALGEQYDAGVANLALADARVRAAARALALAQAGQSKTMTLLQQDAVDAYVGSGPQTDAGRLLAQPQRRLAAPGDRADLRLGRGRCPGRLPPGRRQRQHGAFQLVVARNADAAQVAQLEKDRNQVQAAQDQLVALQAQVKGKIAALVAEIQHEEYLAEQARRRGPPGPGAGGRGGPGPAGGGRSRGGRGRPEPAPRPPPKPRPRPSRDRRHWPRPSGPRRADRRRAPPPPRPSPRPPPPCPSRANPSAEGTTAAVPGVSSAASAAVAAAEGRVGDPYVWGAAGPGAFDCSGLVMWAYAQAGVYLPHYSGAQYDDTIHIPMSDLEPGDLVFPADPGEHVAMYIGNGEIVQAPYTGANVQIVPLTGFFVLASRVG